MLYHALPTIQKTGPFENRPQKRPVFESLWYSNVRFSVTSHKFGETLKRWNIKIVQMLKPVQPQVRLTGAGCWPRNHHHPGSGHPASLARHRDWKEPEESRSCSPKVKRNWAQARRFGSTLVRASAEKKIHFQSNFLDPHPILDFAKF